MKRNFIVFLFCMIFTAGSFSNGISSEIVRLATLEWEPYIGSEIPDNGYIYEIVSLAFKNQGYESDIQFFPWARAVLITSRGELDALFPEYYDENRKKTHVFSNPFPGGPVGLYKRKDNNISYITDPTKDQAKAFKALSDYKFGVVRGYVNTEAFDAADFLSKEEVSSDEINLRKLYMDRVQLIFIDRYVAAHLIRTKYPEYTEHLEFMEPALEFKPLYVAFSKKAPDYRRKLDAFNAGLNAITQDGTLEKIIMKHSSGSGMVETGGKEKGEKKSDGGKL